MIYLDLAAVARSAGLKVVETPGWRKRGHGQMSDVRTITCHHTAHGSAKGTAPSLSVVVHGRPSLEGPLSHYLLGTDGTVYVVAAGLCYHAGISKHADYTNSHAIGIEAEAVGTPGAPGDWPEVQMDAYARLCLALVRHFKLKVTDIRGHKETCAPKGRKVDPSFDMTVFRDRVARLSMTPAKVAPPKMKPAPAKEVPEMQLTDTIGLSESAVKCYNDAGEVDADGNPKFKPGDKVSVNFLLQWGGAHQYRLMSHLKSIENKLDAILASQKPAPAVEAPPTTEVPKV